MAVKCILTGQTPSVLDGVTENVQTQLNDKVDKITGKGLSTNDYTSAEKTKLSSIETGAQKNTITGVKGSAETTYRTGNVNITATNIGLGNVNNTSDAEKPISTATKTALDGKQEIVTGAATTITDNNLTANRALISNSSGKVAVSSVTSTELGYLDGVTSNIQTQLNNKLSSAPVTSVNNKTGAVSLVAGDVGAQPSISANGILKGDGSGNITAASETEVELVSLPNICNPNLLDNWYFGNPVNQRDGHIAFQNTTTYTDAACTNVFGVVQEVCVSLNRAPTGNYYFTGADGRAYYVKASDAVRGYTGAGHTVDRWMIDLASMTVLDDRITLNGALDLCQRCEKKIMNQLLGKRVTLSVLTSDNALYWGTVTLPSARVSGGTFVDAHTHDGFALQVYIDGDVASSPDQAYRLYTASAISILAAKLELGSQQTLAHQENGAWVLNEIPKFGDQLAECQRYYYRLNSHAYGWSFNSEIANCLIPLPVTLRAMPVVTLHINGEINTVTGNVGMASIEVKNLVSNGLLIDVHNTENALTTGTPVVWHNFNIAISADL